MVCPACGIVNCVSLYASSLNEILSKGISFFRYIFLLQSLKGISDMF